MCFFIHHTIWDEQEPFWHIDITDCTLTSFMKKTQCNALNIKTVAKQVWCYFIRGTMPPGCAGPITNLRLFWIPPQKCVLKQSGISLNLRTVVTSWSYCSRGKWRIDYPKDHSHRFEALRHIFKTFHEAYTIF